MYIRIHCQSCGRRLKLPYGADPRKARCPHCRTPIEVPEASPAAKLEAAPWPGGAPKPQEVKPEPLPLPLDEEPVPAPLSLDDDATPLSLEDDEPKTAGPAPFLGPFPPRRFRALVLSDSKAATPLEGPIDIVATPHGLFLEPPGRPFVYAPVGTSIEVSGPGEMTLTLGPREIELRFIELGNPNRLARDLAILLAGQPILIDPAEYRRPRWLLLFGIGLVAALLILPRLMSNSSGNSLVYGAGLALLAALLNAVLIYRSRYSLESKVLLMGSTAALLTLCFSAASWFLVRGTPGDVAVLSPGAAGETPIVEKPPAVPFVEIPAPPPVPPPPSYLEIATEKGIARIEDGPAEVTAIAMVPGRATLLAAYGDGTTRLWALDRPTLEDWRPGPITDGPARSIRFGDGDRIAVLIGPRSTVMAPLDTPPAAPLRIMGDTIAIAPAKPKERDRIAVLRGNRIAVRLLPAGLPAKPTGTMAEGFTMLSTRQESPDTSYRIDLTPPAKLTFLTFHPLGLLMGGQPDGAVLTWPQKGAFKVENTTHKAPVRVLTHGASGNDLALGDDKGVVTLWPNRSLLPSRHAMLSLPVSALAIASKGQMLAAGDGAGKVTIHDVKPAAEAGAFQASGPVRALTFGPNDETIIVAVGRAIEIRMMKTLVKRPPLIVWGVEIP